MIIESLQVENFLSFREANFDFREAGLVLVEGENHDDRSARSNGSGKSAMIDALVWCLFGKTLRGYEHDEVIHRKVGEGCLVAVDLANGDDTYRIVRARRHKKLKNSLIVYHNDVEVSGHGEKDTQLTIEKLLGCTLKTFLSSVVFGQDRAYRFSSLTDSEQKKILDEVLGVERFALACAEARKVASALAAERDANKRALDRAVKARSDAQEDVADLEKKDADFASSQRAKIAAERDKLKRAKDQLDKTRKVFDVDRLKEELSAAGAASRKYGQKLAKAMEADAEARAQFSDASARHDDAADELAKAVSSETCPACGRKADAKTQAIIVADRKKKAIDAQRRLGTANEARDAAAQALAAAKAKSKESEEAGGRAADQYKRGLEASAAAASTRQRVESITERIKELEAEKNPYAELAAKARSRHTQASADVDQIAHHNAEDEEKLARVEFWIKAYGASGLRSLLIDGSLPILNQEAARVSRAITGGSIKVEFSATTEQKTGKVVDRFEVRVDNKHGAGTYAGNSAGERAKVDLCVGLAIQRLVASRSSASFNVAFYDEVFDHLDSAAHERVIDVLSNLDKDSVFVVSHDDDLKAWFPSTLRVVKRGGFSTVET